MTAIFLLNHILSGVWMPSSVQTIKLNNVYLAALATVHETYIVFAILSLMAVGQVKLKGF